MAWYCGESVWYRGRKISVSFRYDCYQDMAVARGKPLKLTKRDERKVKRLLRRQGKAFGHHCGHKCGGPVE
ncbi:MAG: hypothetical protein HYT37_03225 [Candidatus Sungbacteria bacterium]|nr:hypothetical protein [Candidatus Sungbacteria bacterium]